MNEPTLHEAMDACRPGSDDLHLPELKALADSLPADPVRQVVFARVQRLDARLGAAVRDVQIPAGLAERILSRIEAATPLPSDALPHSDALPLGGVLPLSDVQPLVELRGQDNNASRKQQHRRGTWLAWMAGVAAVLLVSLATWTFWPRHQALTGEQLLSQSSGWYSQLADTAAWVRLPPNEMLREYPIASAIRTVAKGWIDATDLVGQNAVAYELAAPRDAMPRCS